MQIGIKSKHPLSYGSYQQDCPQPFPHLCGFAFQVPESQEISDSPFRSVRNLDPPAEGIILLSVLDLENLIVQSFRELAGLTATDEVFLAPVVDLTDR